MKFLRMKNEILNLGGAKLMKTEPTKKKKKSHGFMYMIHFLGFRLRLRDVSKRSGMKFEI